VELSEADHAWVGESLPHAMAFAIALVRDRSEAEDLVHDCYCRLLRKAGQYDLPRDGLKILRRAVANAWVDRRRFRATESLDGLAAGDASAEPHDYRTTEPPQQAMLRELEQQMEEGLSQLLPAQRAALLMKSEGHTLDEIAEVLNVSQSNAGVLIHRARQSLTRWLKEPV
jgi:RNA polymerase sigma factor (sigma-70 family)